MKIKNLIKAIEFIAIFSLGYFIHYEFLSRKDFKKEEYSKYLEKATYEDTLTNNLATEVIAYVTEKKPFIVTDDVRSKTENFSEQFFMQTSARVQGVDINIATFEHEKYPTIRIKSPIDEFGYSMLSGIDNFFIYQIDGKKPLSRIESIDGKKYEVFYREASASELKIAKKRFFAYLLYIKDKVGYLK